MENPNGGDRTAATALQAGGPDCLNTPPLSCDGQIAYISSRIARS